MTGDAPQARLFVVAAPSGAGKTSLVRALMEREPRLRFSTSYTTRPKRPGEVDGRDYFFVDEATFREMEARGEFLEHARVFGNLYGTSRSVILEIDWQGARQVREAMPEAASIFILPPGMAELERRLRGRETDSEPVILRRLADAAADMSHWAEFGHVVINEDFGEAVAALSAIVRGQGGPWRTDRPEVGARVGPLLA